MLMEKQNNVPVGSLLKGLLMSNPKLAVSYGKYKVKSSWAEMMGEYVAKSTDEIIFSGRKMIVKVRSSIIRNELTMIRGALVSRINSTAGTDIIDELIIR